MKYSKELLLFEKVLQKHHIRFTVLDETIAPDYRADMGIRDFLGKQGDYEKLFGNAEKWIRPRTVYKLRDEYFCHYIVFLLSDEGKTALIGPYQERQMALNEIAEIADQYGVPQRKRKQLEKYYSSVPFLADEYPVMALISSLAEIIWDGSENFSVADMNYDSRMVFEPFSKVDEIRPDETLMNMQVMENRYFHENELLQAVEQGQAHRAELMFADLTKTSFSSGMPFEKRVEDPLRNLKNYCIIMNTLLRKSAERGGVHPMYLDNASSEFAFRIEALKSTDTGRSLMGDMIHTYCRLVKNHSMQSYSPQVRRAIVFIDSDLSADLSLRSIASMQNISAGYLSAVFHKETGQTLTDYVNLKRMEHAVRLLGNTGLLVHEVARKCGFSDVNYFGKIFKKYTGVTPKEYRAAPMKLKL